jgi:uncharacterized membrane-anchored protein YhcB (DUF1043 family)
MISKIFWKYIVISEGKMTTKKQAQQELSRLKIDISRAEKFKGKAALIRKIVSQISTIQRHKGDSMAGLILNEVRKEVDAAMNSVEQEQLNLF